MKISYMLINLSGKGRRIPTGIAWQWIHHVEDELQMKNLFLKLKNKIRIDRLTLANLHIEQRHASDEFLEIATFEYKGQIIYDNTISPKRIFFDHEDSDEENFREAI